MTSSNKFSHLKKEIVSKRIYVHPKTGESLPRQLRAGDLCPHPENPKIHPEKQHGYVASSIDELGQIDSIKININNNYIVDGHDRAWLAIGYDEDMLVDVDWLDLTEDAHSKALMLFDYVGEFALWDKDVLDNLLQDVQTDDTRLQAMLSELAENVGVVFSNDGAWGDAFSGLPDSDRAPFQQKTFTLHDEQITIVDDAIRLANSKGDYDETPNENSNGNGLARICEAYLEQYG